MSEPPRANHFVGDLMEGTDNPYVASVVVNHLMNKIIEEDKSQE